MKRVSLVAFVLGSLVGWASTALGAADGDMLPAVLATDVKIRMDGQPGELPGSWTALTRTISGKSLKGTVEVAIAYDDANLYVAMRLGDTTPARTASAGTNEDHATLSLAFPGGKGRYRTYLVDLYPGQPGRFGGVVKVNGRVAGGAQLVEAPDGEGLTFEAKIPWSVFPDASHTRVGLRAGIRYTDASAPGRVTGVVASTTGREGAALPALLTEPEYALYTSVLRGQSIGIEPTFETFGNVGGDGMLERVCLFGRYLTVLGPHFRGGTEYVLSDLQVRSVKQVPRMELADFDGDGKDEIVVVVRIGSEDQYREVVEVLRARPDESLEMAFLHEIGLRTSTGELHNDLKIGRKGSGATLEIEQGTVVGFEQESYAEPKPSDMDSALLPWEGVEKRTVGWQGGKFATLGETKQRAGQSSTKRGSAKVASGRSSAGSSAASHTGSRVAAPPAPRPPSADEQLEQVYALYRKDRGVKAKKPRFDFVTDVVADSQNERVLIHDKDIVCFGKGFREGSSYVFTSIGVGKPEDIVDVTARDLTGDGKAEILVRALLHAKSSKALDEKPVDRLVFMVYQVTNDSVRRVFSAETGRQFDGNLVLGGLRFVPAGEGTEIQILRGRSHGFTAQNYPFPEDTTPAGGFEPLPLPWGSARPRTYRFDGSKYVVR
jgi:hypothetical protein